MVKTTRKVRYNLNQILYEYTVVVINSFKGLDLVDRVPEELWTEAYNIVHEVVTKTSLKKNKCKKAKYLSEEVLQIAEERRETKSKGESERYNSTTECRVTENNKERQEYLKQEWKK